jgi:hypothetical protein
VDAFLRCVEGATEAAVVTAPRGEGTAEVAAGLAPRLLHPNSS